MIPTHAGDTCNEYVHEPRVAEVCPHPPLEGPRKSCTVARGVASGAGSSRRDDKYIDHRRAAFSNRCTFPICRADLQIVGSVTTPVVRGRRSSNENRDTKSFETHHTVESTNPAILTTRFLVVSIVPQAIVACLTSRLKQRAVGMRGTYSLYKDMPQPNKTPVLASHFHATRDRG